jgi:hypothetical protein
MTCAPHRCAPRTNAGGVVLARRAATSLSVSTTRTLTHAHSAPILSTSPFHPLPHCQLNESAKTLSLIAKPRSIPLGPLSRYVECFNKVGPGPAPGQPPACAACRTSTAPPVKEFSAIRPTFAPCLLGSLAGWLPARPPYQTWSGPWPTPAPLCSPPQPRPSAAGRHYNIMEAAARPDADGAQPGPDVLHFLWDACAEVGTSGMGSASHG